VASASAEKKRSASGSEQPNQSNRSERRSTKSESRRIVSKRLADVSMRPIEWLWHGRLARGKHTTIAGESGVSKSTLLYWIAAALSRGRPWPCGEGSAPTGSVVILSAEDGAEDTIKPRIVAAGGDATKVHIIILRVHHHGKSNARQGHEGNRTNEAVRRLRLVVFDVQQEASISCSSSTKSCCTVKLEILPSSSLVAVGFIWRLRPDTTTEDGDD
jgi:hypothetical protein